MCARRFVWLMVVCLSCGLVEAAELGRRNVGSGDVVQGYRGASVEMGVGLDVNLNWNAVDFDIGGGSFDDKAWAPQASIFLGVSEIFDLRATAKYFSAEDDDGAIDVVRLGVGSRALFPMGTDFYPFAAVHLNYYIFSVEGASNEEGMLGLSADLGVAYMISEAAVLQTSVQVASSLMDGEADIAGEVEDVSLSSIGLGVGFSVLF